MTTTKEIKQRLRKEFPTIKFSVRKSSHKIEVSWVDGIDEGATLQAVKAICDVYNTERNVEEPGADPIYIGTPIHYSHEISPGNPWRDFVINAVVECFNLPRTAYDEVLDGFVDEYGYRHDRNLDYYKWLHNGVYCDLSDRPANVPPVDKSEIPLDDTPQAPYPVKITLCRAEGKTVNVHTNIELTANHNPDADLYAQANMIVRAMAIADPPIISDKVVFKITYDNGYYFHSLIFLRSEHCEGFNLCQYIIDDIKKAEALCRNAEESNLFGAMTKANLPMRKAFVEKYIAPNAL